LLSFSDKFSNEMKSAYVTVPFGFGGYLSGENLEYTGTSDSVYAGTDYRTWGFRSLKALISRSWYLQFS